MLKIRLQRVGRIHEPSFRLVLTDSKNSTKSGRFKEVLGSYDPRKATDQFKPDRIKHWLSVGAQATDTVHNLLVTHKIIEGKKVNVLPKKTYNPQPSPSDSAEATTDKEATAGEAVKEEVPVEAPTPAEGETEVSTLSDASQEDIGSDKIEESA